MRLNPVLVAALALAMGAGPAFASAPTPSVASASTPPSDGDARAVAQGPSRQHLAPAGWEESYLDWHYTPVVVVGDTIIVSGIPAAVGDTYEARVRWMFEQLKAHLEAAGATLADVVEINSFHLQPKTTAEFQAEFARFAPIHHEYFPDHYPAWTAVGTTALLADGAPVELRAVAIRGSGARPRAAITRPPPKTPPPAAPPES